jgi:hypothetical protein
MSNGEFVSGAYEIADLNGIPARPARFNPYGVCVDEAVGVTLKLSMHAGERAPVVLDRLSNLIEPALLAAGEQAA